jgi:hypothetical protein
MNRVLFVMGCVGFVFSLSSLKPGACARDQQRVYNFRVIAGGLYICLPDGQLVAVRQPATVPLSIPPELRNQ